MQSLKLKPDLIRLNVMTRLYGLDIPIIGLTGGIACGKSTVANFMRQDGLNVIDADQLIKEIYTKQSTKDFIASFSSEFIKDNTINFPKLREAFFNNPDLKTQLEAFLYKELPHVFLSKIKPNDTFIIYDVPLLFEKKLESQIDQSIVVYAPREIQAARLIARDGITKELATKILNEQLDIETKKVQASFIVNNTSSEEQLTSEYQALKLFLFT